MYVFLLAIFVLFADYFVRSQSIKLELFTTFMLFLALYIGDSSNNRILEIDASLKNGSILRNVLNPTSLIWDYTSNSLLVVSQGKILS